MHDVCCELLPRHSKCAVMHFSLDCLVRRMVDAWLWSSTFSLTVHLVDGIVEYSTVPRSLGGIDCASFLLSSTLQHSPDLSLTATFNCSDLLSFKQWPSCNCLVSSSRPSRRRIMCGDLCGVGADAGFLQAVCFIHGTHVSIYINFVCLFNIGPWVLHH